MTAPAYRGRFAPTPSGPLHFGSLVTAVASWLDARAAGGVWLLRIDDLDPPREVPGAADRILHQLECHGLEWDERVRYQSQRNEAYASAVDHLLASGHAFRCRMTRKELQALDNRHPGPSVATSDPDSAVRAIVPDHLVHFHDRFQSACTFDLRQEGPFVIQRRDGLFGYQLACALDDADDRITHVVRGVDLLASTARQVLVLDYLGRDMPVYGHLPLVTDKEGRKLSKSAGSAALPDAPEDNLVRALRWLGAPASQGPVREQLDAALEWWRNSSSGLRTVRTGPAPAQSLP